ncbi:hypothetical protein [Pedomonas mirosovicensis]|uniref:hypothetical protein n=1 Tax=Pedomonas mirosovicensis TaxID=2908641 RepID=UPI0021687117|nr:hypothetical protein [Pedomonas mirosovicensis]MCH8686089.1 hypothetical protein [Pedomonas mirosovicensis]
MSDSIYTIKPRNGAKPPEDFVVLLHQSELFEHFEFHQISHPMLYFRDEIAEYITQHGLASLYKYSTLTEDVTSPSLSVDDIEKLVAKFVTLLNGAKRILIIDPYFYASSSSVNVADLFKNLLGHASSELEEVIFVTNGKKVDARADIHAAVKALVPDCEITEFVTDDFHDRYWIDPDSDKGFVMGTSLNGLGRKVALVDRLQGSDVVDIVSLAKASGAQI